MICEHLQPLERELIEAGIGETARGQVWTKACREWVYFDCHLDLDAIRERLGFPEFIEDRVNDDPKSGTEKGFFCGKCEDAVMGLRHPGDGKRSVS